MLLTAILASFVASAAFADGSDIQAKDALIQRLERVLQLTESGSADEARLKVRLADLYSERARQKDLEAQGESKEASPDRKQAIALYESVFSSQNDQDKGRTLLQLAQLYELVRQPEKAQALYNKVINAKAGLYEAGVLGQAHHGVGEYEFTKMKYASALKHFTTALNIKDTPKKEQIQYRKAWCLFYTDKVNPGSQLLVDILKSKNPYDLSFREQVSRDYATFLAKGHMSQKDVQQLHDLSPERARIDNLSYLADELERTGKKQSALLVIAILGDKRKSDKDENSTSDQIADQLQKSKIQYDIGKQADSVNEFAAAMNIWKSKGCEPSNDCEVLRTKARKFVTDWGKAGQKEPNINLVRAYEIYADQFDDIEISYWGAEAARKIGQNQVAIKLFRKVTTSARAGRNKDGEKANRQDRMIEGALLGEIEVAELSKDNNAKESAYNHYLNVSPNGNKSVEVRYQLARMKYEAGQYESAAHSFKDVALIKDSRSIDTREKAADLALDSLVLAKREDLIEPWALTFSKTFKRKAPEFAKISRKAVINKAAATLHAVEKGESVDESDLNKQLERLNGMTLVGMTEQERVSYYKNKIILAEKLKNLGEVESSCNNLLKIKSLSRDDREYALSRKAWVAEMKFDFKTAYSITKNLKTSDLSYSERALKLGTLAHMAGLESEGHFQDYLHSTKDRRAASGIAAILVRRSKNKQAAFRKYNGYLRASSDLYAAVSLEVFAQTRDHLFAEAVLRSMPAIRKTPSGMILDRFMYIRQFERSFKKKDLVRIDGRSNNSLSRSLREAIANLRKMENFSQEAIMSGDWTRQVLVITHVAYQNNRLGTQITSLRPPQGLNAKQRREYSDLLRQQAEPYFNKTRQLNARLKDLWDQSQIIESLGQDFRNARGLVRSLLAEEIKLVKNLAPQSEKRTVAKLFEQKPDSVSSEQLKTARTSVKSDPFSVSKLDNLKDLEQKAGRDIVVAYLDARKLQLSGGRP